MSSETLHSTEPRFIATAEELDNLTYGTVIVMHDGSKSPLVKVTRNLWVWPAEESTLTSSELIENMNHAEHRKLEVIWFDDTSENF